MQALRIAHRVAAATPRLANVSGAVLTAIGVLGALAMPAAQAQDATGPRYTYLGAGYEWSDVKNAVKLEGGQFEGYTLHWSQGLLDTGKIGFNVYADYFDGDFTGTAAGDLDATTYEAGIGAHWSLTDSIDLVGKAGYIYAEGDVPVGDQLVNTDDDGYAVEGWLRGQVSENVELEAGYRYEELKDSDISNQDVRVGLGYGVTDQVTLFAHGILFDDDTGFELGVRWYYGSLLGRDSLF